MASAALRPIVIAHRGASGYRPEHTRSAFELAIAMGSDAVEPDLVASSDGVLVVRHENEISGTTDVAGRREFAGRRTTKTVDGVAVTGWFTEDFTWAELSTLRARERLPRVRPGNTQFDGLETLLRLEDLLGLLDSHPEVGLVAELKHTAYFAALGLPLDELFQNAISRLDPSRLTVESFELTPLISLRSRGVEATYVYLVEAEGSPADRPDTTFAAALTDDGLRELAASVHGVSVDKRLLLGTDAAGRATTTDLVDRAHAGGLSAYCWTLRAENRFLVPQHRTRGSRRDWGDWEAEFGLIMGTGVDAVFADQPDLALRAREGLAGGTA